MDDQLTLTVRLHDPLEKADANKAAVWHVVQVDRADLGLSQVDFTAKYLLPAGQSVLAPHK